MKRVVTMSLGMMCVVLAASSVMAQGRGRGMAAPACTTVACDIQAAWDQNAAGFIGIADAMPEDKFGFKPTPAQGSFGERVMHIVGIDVKLMSTLGGKTPAPAVNMKPTTKAEIMAALRQSMDYGSAVLKEFNDQQMSERVTSMPFLGATASRIRIATFSISHSQDIYGQLAVYLRLSGITPPASNRP